MGGRVVTLRQLKFCNSCTIGLKSAAASVLTSFRQMGQPMRKALAIFAMLFVPVVAQASTISLLGGGNVIPMLPNTSGQTATFLISGTDPYVAVDMQMTINGGVGPAPFVTHIFGDTGGVITPAGLYAGSVWVNGSLGITLPPNGTSFDSSGLTPGGGFQTPGGVSITTEGIFLTITFSTVGVFPDQFLYPLSFEGTVLNNGLDENFEPIVVPFDAPTFFIGNIPEPATYVMASMGIVALLCARWRR
jgi:hypothetical protein